MDRYDQIRRLIEASSHIAEFTEFGDGVPQDWINKAEAALGFPLPNSYKWWLSNYGGGEIGGEEIFSIYCQDFDSVAGGDVVYMYRVSNLEADRVPICHSDVDGVFTFDLREVTEDGEYAVVAEGTGSIYAKDFLEFLEKRIEAFQQK